MVDVKVGQHLVWRAADTTGIVGSLKLNTLIWCATAANAIVDGNDLSITDQDGAVLVAKAAVISQVDGYSDVGLYLTWPAGAGPTINGIKVATLDGGELYIWVDTPIRSQA